MNQWNKLQYFGSLPPETMKALTSSACRVLMKLYHYSDGDGGEAYPGLERLARERGISKSSTSAALDLLQELHCVEQIERGGRAGNGVKRASKYQLIAPVSTSEDSEVENESQHLDFESQHPDMESQHPDPTVSTSEDSVPTKPYLHQTMEQQTIEARNQRGISVGNQQTARANEGYTCTGCHRDFPGEAAAPSENLCSSCMLEVLQTRDFSNGMEEVAS
jgi:Helix-turn-helix domain